MSSNPNLPEPSLSIAPTACPFCRSAKVGTVDKKAGSSAYWRCEACGEVWNVARLRAPSRYSYEGRRPDY
jgi:transposase-like protein